jgi:DNA-binding LytR/AlgR family response regulator
MRVVIIEDEIPAAKKLKKMLQSVSIDIDVIELLRSIEESFTWFQQNAQPDLIFMDIELSDGLSFNLIEKAGIRCPIIFITAFDEYWQEAFEYNSIDYLIKPLKRDRLENALNKFSEIRDYFSARYQELLTYQNKEKKFKDRFLVKRGKEFVSINTDDIAFFYATHKIVCLVQKNGSKFILDTSLSEIEKQTAPTLFFRINRKYLIHINSITKISSLPKSKLLVEVAPSPPDELIISSENSGDFKNWMNR